VPQPESVSTQRAILQAANRVFAEDPGASVAAVAKAANLSRATVYRHFESKAELLEALDVEAEPAAQERILEAAVGLVGAHGLGGLSMDELAATAGVSRATLYRLFHGKAALFEALIRAYSPMEEVAATVERLRDRPPEDVIPALVRAVARVTSPRIGILRTLLFEVLAGSPDAVEGHWQAVRDAFVPLGAYLAERMAAGELRPMHPTLAVQTLLGPLILFLLSRQQTAIRAGLDLPFAVAVDQLAQAALRALQP